MLVACLALAAEAFGAHARPKGATPVTIKLVPAFEECFGPNTTHGAPLALPSCSPTLQSSSYLTMNAPDRAAPFTGTASANATLVLKLACHAPATTVETGQLPPCSDPGDQQDVRLTFNAGDIRCVGAPGQALCTSGGGSLYNGKMLIDTALRYTDHHNAIVPNPPGVDCSDTTSCVATTTTSTTAWPIGVQCTSGACNYVTSVDVTVPGAVLEGKRGVIEIGAVEVQDAGLNGNLVAAPAPSTGVCPPACQQDDAASTYLHQGLLIP